MTQLLIRDQGVSNFNFENFTPDRVLYDSEWSTWYCIKTF